MGGHHQLAHTRRESRRSRARIARSGDRARPQRDKLDVAQDRNPRPLRLVGAGRTELAKCVLGLNRVTAGALLTYGQKAVIGSVAEALTRCRMGYVGEDRKQEGLILMHSVLDNTGITIWKRVAGKLGLLTDRVVRTVVAPMIEKLDVRTPPLRQIVANL
jgi:ribose transport system ATP-binding protein